MGLHAKHERERKTGWDFGRVTLCSRTPQELAKLAELDTLECPKITEVIRIVQSWVTWAPLVGSIFVKRLSSQHKQVLSTRNTQACYRASNFTESSVFLRNLYALYG